MKALVVDDDEKNRKLLRDLLALRKLEVVEAATGEDGLAKISVQCRLCVLDLRLPDMDGYTLAQKIREKYPAAYLVAYTASALKEETEKLKTSRLFDAVLLKPINLRDFDEVIGRFWERRGEV
ncbi:MAG TPA: hypothetical protein DCS63_01280 [Elusimicrobia bacterium]|nr:hypothetical protein [Elusimicrobiota bacterium]